MRSIGFRSRLKCPLPICQFPTEYISSVMASNHLEIAPLPTQGITIADAIKASCGECLEGYNIIINRTACEEFLLNLDRKDYEKRVDAEPVNLKFPLQFSSSLDELNVIAMVCLLEGFHSYEELLQERTGRGVWETMRYLVLAAYLSPDSHSGSILTTRGMLEVTPESISTALSLPLHIERPIAENSPISMAEPDQAVVRFVEDLLNVLHSTGKILQQSGLPNLASFLASRAKLNDDEMIRQLAGAFSAFRDMYTLDNKHVYLMKRVLFLVYNIQNTSISFPNLKSIRPILADSLLPVFLIQAGLLDSSNSTESSLQNINGSDSHLKMSSRSATILRASSVACCEYLINLAQDLSTTNESVRYMERDGLIRYLSNLSRERCSSCAIREETVNY
ncbi:hypothetical protein PSHT_02083 [Puccinia striiformis]|uniref:Queuosine 5'-phosphate N-glycosylase/hydrolase n=3 Tax=Puccinia striiformis TaxID=27350 RepID=A0A2S4UJ28_9BASI|nr:hypothetical protein H4Q26_000509 [Puccinia striiformis f. sp. tritici PST-130]KAI9603582.1 hypothetical protein KEM48_000882 [Puccinia striiformis f. sp. tritici PST-130]POV97322.1 hypothetical protein PSTT_15125 [Puccinia striiformis]POW21695.1 hypothetical protein PSHT_02083 [Puccinia striiformis]